MSYDFAVGEPHPNCSFLNLFRSSSSISTSHCLTFRSRSEPVITRLPDFVFDWAPAVSEQVPATWLIWTLTLKCSNKFQCVLLFSVHLRRTWILMSARRARFIRSISARSVSNWASTVDASTEAEIISPAINLSRGRSELILQLSLVRRSYTLVRLPPFAQLLFLVK